MKRLLVAASLLLVAAGCTSESGFPEPTGKGSVRGINAIKGSPDASFRIEENLLEALTYKASSSARRWDDFQYTFNFDVFFRGEASPRRVASSVLKVEADRDYTLVMTGDVESPTILTWESEERSFADGGTVFEARFAHLAATLGDIDVYFAAPDTPPAAGEARGSLSFGDTLPPIDVEAGDYVLTMTAAGDPGALLFQSDVFSYSASNAYIVPLFDGDENDVAPHVARRINAAGGQTPLPDDRFAPTVRFFQASIDLPPSDIYDDEMLTNLVLADHRFGDITDDLDAPAGVNQYSYTPAGNSGAIQFEAGVTLTPGTHTNFVVSGLEGSRVLNAFVPERRSIARAAALRIFPVASNHGSLDLYVVDAGESIDDAIRRGVLAFRLQSGSLLLDAGSYDIYLTVFNEKTIVTGPVRLDLALGDAVEAVIFDTTDPATAEFRIVPAP